MGLHLSLRKVSKTFHGDRPHTALSELDLDVRAGELLTLVGPSGCGKSTLFALIAGLTEPTTGEIRIGGAPVTGPALDRGVVVQQYTLFPWRTALGNVEFGLEGDAGTKRERARELLALVGMSGYEECYPQELSAGRRELVALARSLAFAPGVLLMDEPFAGLDRRTREWVGDEFVRIVKRTGSTAVLATHDVGEAVRVGRRVAVMTPGPGRIKEIVDVRARAGNPRRHVGRLLRDAIAAARGRKVAA
ncbi:Taurine transport ATP-binding protein TauB [[Actinomadura] parvosata subsp. kistnae]|uniref:ABC transporter ATP-binding protein n=1 Tax=[Actinomadura] parvosata subsp. kistnae TaxID=1909395 RepID=A0A1V0A5A7_9ACTN|nr:ABC transporter ATP-binding protein [Nonomuraea sp. ATCC 55076]AQZ65406.1 ABC transporter ATP-binding protein [Nonomuraea sp. ATCC 55076]SPL96736.1 Taurine transport ATP-binding protein TauB [Actinomadura parvosata subsp. kistnae]